MFHLYVLVYIWYFWNRYHPTIHHRYEAQIKKLPDEIIFRGVIDIGVLVGLYLKDNIAITDDVTGQIVQP